MASSNNHDFLSAIDSMRLHNFQQHFFGLRKCRGDDEEYEDEAQLKPPRTQNALLFGLGHIGKLSTMLQSHYAELRKQQNAAFSSFFHFNDLLAELDHEYTDTNTQFVQATMPTSESLKVPVKDRTI
eukprot:GEZU01003904.1.p1 GENE.GEZU01003904.1~~GEZU01003904.1.p1  ORF type:complete len:136 (-),score=17.99 GEZU01003904.1:223-603(-)